MVYWYWFTDSQTIYIQLKDIHYIPTLIIKIHWLHFLIIFCLQDMLEDYFDIYIIDGGLNDTRLVGSITLVCVLALAIIGMDWVTRVSPLAGINLL